jgi:hypothetical protein
MRTTTSTTTTANIRKATTMQKTTTRNEEKNITRRDWEMDGYTLTITTFGNRSNRITISSPLDAPGLRVDDFKEEPEVQVNWSAIGNVGGDVARDYAAKIVAAANIAETFQDIIDILN